MIFAIPVQRSTNWANKPTGSWELVERCTGIAEVMGSNPIRAWTILRPYFHYFLSNAHNCEDRFHIRFFNRSSRIWFSCIYSREQKGFITPFNFPPVGGWKFPLKIVKTNCFMFLESPNGSGTKLCTSRIHIVQNQKKVFFSCWSKKETTVKIR